MFGFIKRMLGIDGGKPALSTDLASRENRPPQVPVVPVRSAPPVVLLRDEIIDSKTRIAGYRFSARRPDSAALPDPSATL